MKFGLGLKIAAFTSILIFLIGTGLFGIVVYEERTTIHKLRMEESAESVRRTASQVEEHLFNLEIHQMRRVVSNVLQGDRVDIVWVLDETGRVLTDGSAKPALRNQKPPAPFVDALMAANAERQHMDGTHHWTGIPVFAGNDIPLGYVVIAFRQQRFDERLQSSIINQLIILGPALFIGIFAAFFFARRITSPLEALTSAAEQIGAGNWGITIKTDSKDEVGKLARTINAMAGSLSQIAVSRSNLEKIVEERTAELKHHQEELERLVSERTHSLATSEARFKDFAESASDWFWEMDADLRFKYFSSSFSKFLTGVDPKENLGKTRREIGWAEDDDAKWEAHLADLDARRPFKDFRYMYLDASNEEHHWEISGKPIFDDNGAFLGYRGAGRDITESKRASEQLENYIHELDFQRGILEEQATKGVELAEELALQKAAVEANEEKLRTIFETASEGIITIDDKGIIQSFNKAAEITFGYDAESVIGQTVNMLMPEDTGQAHDGHMSNYLETGESKIIGVGREVTGQRSDGTTFPMKLAISEMHIGGKRMFTGMLHDITARKEAEEKIRHMATHDALTDLPSLRLGKERLNDALAYAHRHKNMAALMFIDLDGFKQVNDTLGHDAGDAVLIETAQRLKNCVRETDTIARIGGDEFLAIVTEAENTGAVETFAKKIIAAISTPYEVSDESGEITTASIGASVGIALYPNHGSDAEELVKAADNAMYVVKKAGKNNFGWSPLSGPV